MSTPTDGKRSGFLPGIYLEISPVDGFTFPPALIKYLKSIETSTVNIKVGSLRNVRRRNTTDKTKVYTTFFPNMDVIHIPADYVVSFSIPSTTDFAIAMEILQDTNSPFTITLVDREEGKWKIVSMQYKFCFVTSLSEEHTFNDMPYVDIEVMALSKSIPGTDDVTYSNPSPK